MIKSNLDSNKSYVQKRNGIYQEIDYSKIQNRLKYLAIGYPDKANSIQLKKLKHINHFDISKKVIESLINKIHTNEIDEMAANICHNLSHDHIENDIMASRIIISNHHKKTRGKTFLGLTEYLYFSKDKLENKYSIVNTKYYKFAEIRQIILKLRNKLDTAFIIGGGFKIMDLSKE